jgi:hypothetical protein
MPRTQELDAVARAAIAIAGIESAAIFVRAPGGSDLELAGAAGIEGPPLDGLIAAVRNPMHPVTRALSDPGPTFDVTPMNPGGPALRSHLPLRSGDATADEAALGVLAVAHEAPLSPDARVSLEDLARSAAERIRA